MSDLRTRIAAAAVNAHYSDGDAWADAASHDRQYWLTVADAVIGELGLRQEWGALDDTDSGICADTKEELRVHPAETLKSRYITEWEVDE